MTRMERGSLIVLVLVLACIIALTVISVVMNPKTPTDALVEVRRVGGDRVWKFQDGPFTCYVYRDGISCGR